MKTRGLPAAHGTAHATARIEVDVAGRWSARALLGCLTQYGSFLIQRGPEQWVVHARTPGCHGEDMESALAAIEKCLDERGVEETSIRIDGKPYRPRVTTGSRA